MNTTVKKRSKKGKTVKSSGKVKLHPVAIILLALFLIMLILLGIHNINVQLNEEVRVLQEQLNQVNSEIDSKNGQIMSNADLKTVEAQARALGMTEAQPQQFIYEAAAKKQTVISSSPVGLNDYLSFYKQVRREGLWPQGQ